MSPQEADALQRQYQARRRAWADEIGRPYPSPDRS